MESYVLEQVKITLCVVLGNLMLGYSIGWSAPVALKLKDPELSPLSYPILDEEISWVVSTLIIGSLFGVNAGGYIADRIGRKHCILAFSLIHLVGYMLIANAWSYGAILAGRTLAGSAGSITVTNLVYIGEIAIIDLVGYLIIVTGAMLARRTLVGLAVSIDVINLFYIGEMKETFRKRWSVMFG